MRFSSRDPGLYSISVLDNKKVKHYRIIHKAGTKFRLANVERNSLEELLTVVASSLSLLKGCVGSPFARIWSKEEKVDDDYASPYNIDYLNIQDSNS